MFHVALFVLPYAIVL